jgi:ornithine carbamoyltransferase
MEETQEGSRGMKGRDFLSVADLSATELATVLDTAAELKAQTRKREPHPRLNGLAVALVFEKPSLRTRLSFDIGMFQLGGRAFYLSPQEIGLGKREAVRDVARVIGSMADGIVARVNRHTDLVELAQYSPVPVVNALSDLEHPCQILADFLTVRERFGKLEGLKLAYIGDGNNMAHSLMLGAALVGMNITIISPSNYTPLPQVLEQAEQIAGGRSQIQVVSDPIAGVRGADIVYTDVWASMGQEDEAEERREIFAPYQLNEGLLEYTHPETLILHCLPAHRGEEITEEVLESPQSWVFQQAENRLHAQKALLVHLLGQ